jgi:3-oxoacyl-[acyl-carrier-protein] synthase II
MGRRVVITGLGLVSPVGNTVESAWNNIINGVSGINSITKFDVSNFSVRIGGEVRGFNIEEYITAKEARHMDTFIHYGVAAGMQAIKDSGIDLSNQIFNPERIGVIVGSGIGGLPLIENNQDEFRNKGPRRISPFLIPGAIINMISGHISILHGFQGPNLAVVTACTTGLHCIGEASRLIEYGDADIMVAGGAESTICPLGLGGFASMRALSTNNDSPAAASCPWNESRDGFVLGEGAGVLILEEYEHAKKRGAKIYCEIAGYGMGADASHMTAPLESGLGAIRCMKNALNNAKINVSDVNYINAHGTSTPLGDIAETNAIIGMGLSHAVTSSTKSMTGHLLGGAGGLESVFTTLAIYNGIIPPTINLHNQDPKCTLDYCANTARDAKIKVALKNSFGFGGTNGSLVFVAL